MADVEPGHWLKRIAAPERASRRLICFGHAGSTYAVFNTWAALLGAATEIVGISLPGRGRRIDEAPRSDISAMANEIAGAITGLPPLPTILFGHSVGGIFAYEVAHELVLADGARPSAVVISASGTSTRTQLHDVNELDAAAVRERFLDSGYLSTEQVDNAKFVELVLPYLTADILCKKYWRPERRPRLPLPIHCFAWSKDEFLEPSAMQSWRAKSDVPELCESFEFPGGHMEYLSHPPDMFAALDFLFSRPSGEKPHALPARDRHAS